MKRITHLTILFLALISLTSACGMKKMATNVLGKVATDGMVSFESEDDLAFASQSAPALIKALEVFSYGNPRDVRMLTLLARAYGEYAFGIIEEEYLQGLAAGKPSDEARLRIGKFYERGKTYGIAALSTNSKIARALRSSPADFRKAVSGLSKKDVPAMFWAAFNWAGWLNQNLDDPQAIADLPKIQALMDRVIELDPKMFFGSAYAIRGTIAVSRPKMLGGDPMLAGEDFSKAFAIAPDYLMSKVIYAQYYARQNQDKALFTSTLNGVLEAGDSGPKEARLANEFAKRRAKILLSMKDKLF